MIAEQGVDKNFRFMVLEVEKQLDKTAHALLEADRNFIGRIRANDNYIDILKNLIEKKCLAYFRHAPTISRQSAELVSAVNVAVNNLERIGDFCVNIMGRLEHLERLDLLGKVDFRPYFDVIRGAMQKVTTGLDLRDTSVARELCEAEMRLNELHDHCSDWVKAQFRSGKDTDDLLCVLYISHYLERIGDSLLNIGEAILFAATGERLKMQQFLAIEQTMGHVSDAATDVAIESPYETRSGSRVTKLHDLRAHSAEHEAIFKHGASDKLQKEKENIERWDALMPGLPPRILEYRPGDRQDATLLLEFLDGYTLQDIVLGSEPVMIDRAMDALKHTVHSVWSKTRNDRPVNAGFLQQLSSRLDDVFHTHPDFRDTGTQVGSLAVRSFDTLVGQALEIDRQLTAPFSVLIHGDFNADNIIYNDRNRTMHFIDLYRSRQLDYVQDVSVFMVSNFRMPVFDTTLRGRLNDVIISFYEFARDFARDNQDGTFEARLAMGLARSFSTSTRFELNEEFAQVMHLRATYLLDRLLDHRSGPWDAFTIPQEAFVY